MNHVASPRHLALVSGALAAHQISLFGSVPSRDGLAVPSRHLGLVQAADFDTASLEVILDHAADLIDEYCDLDAILDAAQRLPPADKAVAALPLPVTNLKAINPPAKTIAVANDAAFGFAYHHLLAGWQQQGAEIRPFSPLNDEKPADDADFIFLPGGYPELHLPTLSRNRQFLAGLNKAATANIPIYGECGGYMVLGTGITDASGNRFDMAGLLDVETSFANKKRHLGYRKFTPIEPFFWNGPFLGHEFHYTNVVSASGTPLFTAHDANDQPLGMAGLRKGSVAGSYLHIIAQS